MTIGTDGGGLGAVSAAAADRERLVRELAHVVGRTRAFLAELAASERELTLMQEPRAAPVLAAMAAVREVELEGSLAAVERVGTGLLRLLTG